MALRWGIAASGKIANDFVLSLRTFPKSEHVVTAVAARSLDNASKFAQRLDIPNAYEGYEKLGNDPNVDVVYVATIHHTHYETTKMLLENDKHVVCEKPFTLNEKQTRKLIDVARRKKKFLTEGMWSRCFPASKQIKEIIDSGQIGEVMQLYVDMGVSTSEQDRVRSRELEGGMTLSMGVYNLVFQQYIFKGLSPIRLVANGHLNEEAVDTCSTSVTTYPGNKLAVASVSGLVPLSFQGVIYGSNGKITIDKIWSPTSFKINDETVKFSLPENPDIDKFINPNNVGLAYEAEEVRNCIREGKVESPLMTHADTIEVASLIDRIRNDIGVVYSADLKSY